MHSTPYMNGRATARGVFKAYVFFFCSIDQLPDTGGSKLFLAVIGGNADCQEA